MDAAPRPAKRRGDEGFERVTEAQFRAAWLWRPHVLKRRGRGMSDELWTVTVTEDATGAVVKTFTADSFRRADKLADGLMRNLDHERFSVVVEHVERGTL